MLQSSIEESEQRRMRRRGAECSGLQSSIEESEHGKYALYSYGPRGLQSSIEESEQCRIRGVDSGIAVTIVHRGI